MYTCYIIGSIGGPSFSEVPLNTAWNNLRNSVVKKQLQIQVQFDKNVSILCFLSRVLHLMN